MSGCRLLLSLSLLRLLLLLLKLLLLLSDISRVSTAKNVELTSGQRELVVHRRQKIDSGAWEKVRMGENLKSPRATDSYIPSFSNSDSRSDIHH